MLLFFDILVIHAVVAAICLLKLQEDEYYLGSQKYSFERERMENFSAWLFGGGSFYLSLRLAQQVVQYLRTVPALFEFVGYLAMLLLLAFIILFGICAVIKVFFTLTSKLFD